jgi:hypothetical protein
LTRGASSLRAVGSRYEGGGEDGEDEVDEGAHPGEGDEDGDGDEDREAQEDVAAVEGDGAVCDFEGDGVLICHVSYRINDSSCLWVLY